MNNVNQKLIFDNQMSKNQSVAFVVWGGGVDLSLEKGSTP